MRQGECRLHGPHSLRYLMCLVAACYYLKEAVELAFDLSLAAHKNPAAYLED